jgi:DNA-binding GntR family transcriptional regulator
MKNPFLLDTYENISNLNRRIRLLSGAHSENRIADTFAEHMKIISACQKKDWEAAANAMTEHLEQSRVVSFQMLAENEDAF